MVAMPLCQAVSDTDVYLIKAGKVAFVIHKLNLQSLVTKIYARKITSKASR